MRGQGPLHAGVVGANRRPARLRTRVAGSWKLVVVPRAAGNVATVAEAFRLTADRRPDDVPPSASVDDAVRWTWSELRTRVDALASALHRLGLRPGDALALQLGSRPEFHLADLAAMMVGATPSACT